jgi:hypothetical protein
MATVGDMVYPRWQTGAIHRHEVFCTYFSVLNMELHFLCHCSPD